MLCIYPCPVPSSTVTLVAVVLLSPPPQARAETYSRVFYFYFYFAVVHLQFLDASPVVERYAWFTDRWGADTTISLLMPNASALTHTGQVRGSSPPPNDC